jgi:hypothetical protein
VESIGGFRLPQNRTTIITNLAMYGDMAMWLVVAASAKSGELRSRGVESERDDSRPAGAFAEEALQRDLAINDLVLAVRQMNSRGFTLK